MKIGLPVLLLVLSLFTWNASSWAVPLSLSRNIEAIVAQQTGIRDGFDFVVLGDSRDGAEIYARLLSRAKTFRPLFIIHTGDFVRKGDPGEYENYTRQIAPDDIPLLHIPGNHDVRQGEKVYHRYVGEANWFFDLGPYRFIGLDNAGGNFSAEAAAFARKTLTPAKTCLVAFHYPPAVGRWAVHALKDDQRGENSEVFGLIKKARVPLVFLGHIHLHDEMNIDGTRFIISAGGGADLYGKYNFGRAEYGFSLVQVRPQGITHRWVPLE